MDNNVRESQSETRGGVDVEEKALKIFKLLMVMVPISHL